MADDTLLIHTVDIVAAHVANNDVQPSEVPALIESVYVALSKAAAPAEETPQQEPAVPIRLSIRPDYLICLEDGRKVKMLKRYLRFNYDMSPEEYRAKWHLPRDYPMVAPYYSEQRRTLAKQIGLGRRTAEAVEAVAAPVVEAVKRGARKLGISTPAADAGRSEESAALPKPARRTRSKSAAEQS